MTDSDGKKIAADFAMQEHRALREEIMHHIGALDRVIVRTVTLTALAYLIAFSSRLKFAGVDFVLTPIAGLLAAGLPIPLVFIARRNFDALVGVTRDIGAYIAKVEAFLLLDGGSEARRLGWETRLRSDVPWNDPEIFRSEFWGGLQCLTVVTFVAFAIDFAPEIRRMAGLE